MTKKEILALAQEGITIHAAFAGKSGWPETFQSSGLQFSADGKTLRLFVSQRSFPCLLELDRGKRIAVTFAQPVTLKTAQVKGLLAKRSPITESDLDLFNDWFQKICFEYGAVDVPAPAIEALSLRPDMVLECEIDSFFSQTPGPRAGERV
jgi:hypothetical protein